MPSIKISKFVLNVLVQTSVKSTMSMLNFHQRKLIKCVRATLQMQWQSQSHTNLEDAMIRTTMLDRIKAFKTWTMDIWETIDRTLTISIEAANHKILEIRMVMRSKLFLLILVMAIQMEVDAIDLNIYYFITFINFSMLNIQLLI